MILAAVGVGALGMIVPVKTAGQDSPPRSLIQSETKAASGPLKKVVDPNIPCLVEELLGAAGRQIEEFVRSLERFSATEHVEHYSIDKTGNRKKPETRTFNYAVNVNQAEKGLIWLEEFRNGSTDPEMFPAHLATFGLPGLDLIFHPMLSSDFDFQCEGMGQWEGREAWQVHFVQRADRPARIRAYRVNREIFPVELQGRAWIDPVNHNVIRLESELAKPVPQIGLTQEHLAISYAPVRFASTGEQVWLPQEAELHVEMRGKRFYRQHRFSDFKLFSVDTAQSWQPPAGSYSFTNLTDGEVKGELTVLPAEGSKRKAVTLRFVLPPRGTVVKTVGPKKDVNLPAGVVEAARFVHSGEAGSVWVKTNLPKETTVDVIPGSTVGEKP